jgi:hypothetical protein
MTETTDWRAIVGALVSTWNRGWDCSRDPGHVEMNRVIAEAEDALSDSVFGSATKSADGG